MALCYAVITFSGFTLSYACVAPHPQYILRRFRSSEDFGGNFGSGGAKNHRYFFSCNMFRLTTEYVSFTLVCFCVGLLFCQCTT